MRRLIVMIMMVVGVECYKTQEEEVGVERYKTQEEEEQEGEEEVQQQQ